MKISHKARNSCMRVFAFWEERGQLELFLVFPYELLQSKGKMKDGMGVSSCNSVNSEKMYNVEIMKKCHL